MEDEDEDGLNNDLTMEELQKQLRKMFVMFIDFKAAFDRVNRRKLF